MTPSASALERCLGDTQRFVADTWGRAPSLRTDAGSFSDVLSVADVDRIVTTMSLRTPAFRLVKDGATLPESSYTKRGRIGSKPVTGIADPARILEHFRGGATIVLQGMHRYWPPLARLCRDLELTLGHPSQANAYITPPGSRGLGVHADEHDVFVLQAFGRKRWDVWATGEDAKTPSGDPVISRALREGDVLYMPKGTPHAARTQEGASGHVTIGVVTTTWRAVLEPLIGRLLDEPQFAAPLPAGYHRDRERFAADVTEQVRELQRWLDKADARETTDRFVDDFLRRRPSLLAGAFSDGLAVDAIGPSTSVRRRDGSACDLRARDGRLSVFLGDREVRMPPWVEPAMREIASTTAPFSPRDLAAHLDADSAVVLVKRLVREGLLTIAAHG